MLSQALELKFAVYLCVASLSILLWDILDTLKKDYCLLFRHRVERPTMVYFLSRVSLLGYVFVTTILLTTQSIACKAVEAALITFFIINLVTTLLLSYFRVCAVWHWNRFIMGFFGVSLLAVIASSFTLISSLRGSHVEGYCIQVLVGDYILAPFITSSFNHAVIFLAITYGVCRNTMGRDLTSRDCVQLMLGKNLPTFSKALLHDSQVCYINATGFAIITVIWFSVWFKLEPTSSFPIAMIPPYSVLVNIMICRVFRNAKLGLYSKVPVHYNAPKSPTESDTTPNGIISWNSTYNATDSDSNAVIPIQVEVNQVVEYETDPARSKRHANTIHFLDFGMV